MEEELVYASVYGVDPDVWKVMSKICETTCSIALFFIPSFWAIHFTILYAKQSFCISWNGRLICWALVQGIGLILFICYFGEIMGFLDYIIVSILDQLDVNDRLIKLFKVLQDTLNKLENDCINTWTQRYIDSDQGFGIWGTMKRFIIDGQPLFWRHMVHALRGYLLVFSTQVGPLAMALSILPGRFGLLGGHWLGVHLGLLMWGIMLGLLDLLAIELSFFTDFLKADLQFSTGNFTCLIGYLVWLLLYGVAALCMSIYMGYMLGGGGFRRAGDLFSQQMAAYGIK